MNKITLKSLAAVASPEQYAAMSLIKRDCYQGFAEKVYVSALQVANKAQETCLMAEIGRQRITT